MQHWQQDRDFGSVRLIKEKDTEWTWGWKMDGKIGVRGADALAQQSEAERQQWQKLRQEVEALLQQAAPRIVEAIVLAANWQEVEALLQQAAAKTKPPTAVDQSNRKKGSPRKN
jgi:riboflavin biosynthesis pyrimidine reductase